jgi:hypothetical protein
MSQTVPPPPHPDPARKAGQAMSDALRGLLDRVPGARQVLPYLAALESGLAAEGTAVLDIIPIPSLQRMGAQLASLPVDPTDLPLRALQVALLSALSRRNETHRPSPSFGPSALGPSQVEVVELGDTDWAAASDLFEVTQPAPPDPQRR